MAQEAQKATPDVAMLNSSTGRARQLLLVTQWVHDAAKNLKDKAGAMLTMGGKMYPPATALHAAALSEFCDRMVSRAAEVVASQDRS